MKNSVFFKTFGGHLLIICLLAALVLIFTFSTIRSFYIRTMTQTLNKLALAMQPNLSPLIQENNYDSLNTIVGQRARETGTRITVIAPDGTVLADSEKDARTMENHKNRLEIIQALESGKGTSIRFSRTVKQEMLYVALSVRPEDKTLGIIRCSLYLSDIDQLLNNIREKILFIALISVFISIGIAFMFSRNLSKPIHKLVDASRQVARGDFNGTILFKRQDEFKELADSFNHMVLQIKTLITELSQEKEALNTIISSIQEGVVAVDNHGKIVLSNKSFRKMVNTSTTVEKYYWELVRRPELSDMVKSITQNIENVEKREIEIDGRHFMCSAAAVGETKLIVFTFYDITELVNISQIKKEFVLNVSHELRTPLTAIKGFVETLEGETTKKGKKYLQIIERHTNRLISIVKDLQTLSQLEEKGEIESEPIDLHSLINTVLKMFQPSLREKKIKIDLDFVKPDLQINADPVKLQQVFINLIDNAIKYTEKGSITIATKKEDSSVYITVTDTGIGIPEEHISRIFERFYVVDKSRSRKMGGTGLGLSIVKHIIQAHHGDIIVESKENQGTQFTVILPS